ncbi:MAG TPA: hypothetical protein VGD08_11365 [Stellaceae bacterium]
MTYSDFWIDTVDDDEFEAILKKPRRLDTPREDKIHLMPPTPRPGSYWINVVGEWAAEQNLAIQYVDPIAIGVLVTRAQLLRFLDDTFGPEAVGKVASCAHSSGTICVMTERT